MTAPKEAPESINNAEEGLQSAVACMNLFKSDPEKYLSYDGYLICCFSDHPLVYQLREAFESTPNPPIVLGIFQSAVLYVLAQVTGHSKDKACILTSGNSWKPLLDKAVYEMIYGEQDPSKAVDFSSDLPAYFLPTEGSGVGVLELADPHNYETLKSKVRRIRSDGGKYVILGCAGLSSMDGKFKKDFPDMVFIDSVKCGIETLCGYARFACTDE
ncbi:DEKNAAC101458 [Brettanomyces naardenensis]|uniref:DEKNAAC101458 n=1 Tax=Brettanomyces naardenensis TaxID=13370 RepID=A0A448YI71_BRENA|nr:DEKNAAC101458 [Brettanomyces naardenensis]